MAVGKIILGLELFKTQAQYTSTGTYIKCSCPNKDAHKNEDKNPSFVFYKNSKIGKCFSCGFSITLQDFAVKYKNIKPDQIEGIDLVEYRNYIFLKTFEKWCKENLLKINDSNIVAKFLEYRGIPRRTWKYLSIGYYNDNIEDLSLALQEGLIESDKAVKYRKKEKSEPVIIEFIKKIQPVFKYRNFLTISHDMDTEVPLSFQGRYIHKDYSFGKKKDSEEYKKFKDEEKRTINTYDALNFIKNPEIKFVDRKGKGLFGICDINKAFANSRMKQKIVITEGELNSIQPKVQYLLESKEQGISMSEADQLYSGNVIAIGSSTNFKALKELNDIVERVCFAFDNDEPGFKGLIGSANTIKNKVQSVVELPEKYKDPDEFCLANGYSEWKKLQNQSVSFSEYFTKDLEKYIRSCYELDDDIELNQAREYAINRIIKLSSEAIIQDICKKIGKLLRYINVESFFNEVNSIRIKKNVETDFEVFEKTRCTYTKIYSDKGKKQEKLLANFTIVLVNNLIVNDVIIREVYLENEKGDKSKHFLLTSDIMISAERMKSKCLELGYYAWYGSNSDLMALWKMKLYYDTGKRIYQPNHIGFLKKHRLFLFADAVIRDEKIYYENQDDKVIWIDEAEGFKVENNIYNEGQEALSNDAPYVLRNKELLDRDTGTFDMEKIEAAVQDIPNKIHSVINGGLGKKQKDFDSLLGLGWAVAVLYKDVIVDYYKDFPFLFLTGQMQSGKSTYGRWIMCCFGMDNDGENLLGSTIPGQQRNISYYCNLPYWLDEYDNDPKIQQMVSFHKSVYAQGTFSKAMRDNMINVYKYYSNSTILFSGEHEPPDQGLKSRCVFINFSEEKRSEDKALYKKTQTASHKFVAFSIWTLINRNERSEKLLMNNIVKREKEFLKQGIDERTAKHYAICLESYLLIFKYCRDEFCEYVSNNIASIKEEKNDSEILNEMFLEIDTLVNDSNINLAYFDIKYFKPEEVERQKLESNLQYLRIKWNAVYDNWRIYRGNRLRSTVFEKATIQKYLKDKKYVVKHNDKITRNIYVNTRTDSGWCEFRLENLYNPPKGLTMLANTIQNKKQTYQSKMMS